MRILDTPLPGLKIIEADPIADARGALVRIFDAKVFAQAGLDAGLAQASLSHNHARGTLRGLHFQAHPRMEAKLVRCARGAIFDVAVDIRPGSPTYGKWYGTELSACTDRQLYIPAGFAHGFQTLEDDTTVAYHIDISFEPALTAGLRHDDPALAIDWPLPPQHLSDRDRGLPPLADLDPAVLLPFG